MTGSLDRLLSLACDVPRRLAAKQCAPGGWEATPGRIAGPLGERGVNQRDHREQRAASNLAFPLRGVEATGDEVAERVHVHADVPAVDSDPHVAADEPLIGALARVWGVPVESLAAGRLDDLLPGSGLVLHADLLNVDLLTQATLPWPTNPRQREITRKLPGPPSG